MAKLTACTRCRRHVKRGETSCPFCGAAVTEARAARFEAPTVRLRAVAVGAAIAATACGSGNVQAPEKDGGMVAQPAYGGTGIPVEAGSETGPGAGGSDAGMDSPVGQPHYGGVSPPDSGQGGG